MEFSLESLGMTKEELRDRVIQRIADQLLNRVMLDDEGEEVHRESVLKKELDTMIREQIDKAVENLADKYVLPKVSTLIENFTLTQTNEWGERRSDTVSFVEYLVQRAEAYMTEKVNYEGKAKRESSYSSWDGTQTRITHMIEKHLHYSIASAMENALKDANSQIVKGLEETCKVKLAEISAKLKVEVKP